MLFSAVSKTYLWIDGMIHSNKIASRNQNSRSQVQKFFKFKFLEIIKKGGDKRRSVLFSAVSKTYLWIDDMIRSNKIASRNQNSVNFCFKMENNKSQLDVEDISLKLECK